MDIPLRIVLADDHSLFRQGLKSLLKLQADVEVVGETERLADVPALLAHTPCDLLLLDLAMERNALTEIATFAQQVQVIVVTASEHTEETLEAMRCGARAVVFKRFAVETLMVAIRAVAAGLVWMPPALQAHLVASMADTAPGPLTPREREVIRHVAHGLRNAEVGKQLSISEQTVKTHLNNIFQKLGIRDRVELTLYAARVGIIGIHERSS